MSYADQEIKAGKFFKLENGVPTDIRLLNDTPFSFSTHGFGKQTEECGGDHCRKCDEGSEPTQRWSTNVYDFASGRVKVWTYTASVARALKRHDKALAEEGKTLTSVDLRVMKEGEGVDTEYTITTRTTAKPLPEGLKLYSLDVPF